MTTCRSGNAAFDFETQVDIATPGCVANPTGNPTGAHTSLPQSHFVHRPAAVYSIKYQLPRNPQIPQHVNSPAGCSTSLSVNPFAVQDNIFKDVVNIQRKQTELSQIIVFPSEQGAFNYQVSLQCFIVILWNFLQLRLPLSL